MIVMVRCGQPNADGSPCRRPLSAAGGCGVDHSGRRPAGVAAAKSAAARVAAAGGDPFDEGGDLYDTAGLTREELGRRAETAVEMRGSAAEFGDGHRWNGSRLESEAVAWRQGVLALEDPRCPARVLRAAYRTGNAQLVSAALRNPRCPRSVLVRYWLEAGAGRTHAVHPRTPKLLLRWWARKAVVFGGRRSSRAMIDGLAENPRTPPRSLARLVVEGSHEIQERVAANPSCPPETLSDLAVVDRKSVRAAALSNPRQDPDVLARAADGGEFSPDVLAAVAANPSTPPAALERLVGHRHPDVRAAAAANPNTLPAARAHAGLLAD